MLLIMLLRIGPYTGLRHVPDRSSGLYDLQNVATLGLSFPDGAGGEFENGMRREAGGQSPGRNGFPRLFHAVLSIKIDQVDGELHEEGVDGLAWDDPHPFPWTKAFATQQTF